MRLSTEQHTRRRQVLAKLEILSEAKTANLEGHTAHGKPGTKPPPGAMPGRDVNACPPRDRSLYDHYRWKLDRATNEFEARLILRAAERAWEQRVMGADNVTFPTSPRKHRDEEREARWVVEHGVGLSAAEIASELLVSRGWVEKVRRENRQRPKDGQPVPGFIGLGDVDRHKAVQKLRNRGMKQTTAAAALGVSRQTVQRYWH